MPTHSAVSSTSSMIICASVQVQLKFSGVAWGSNWNVAWLLLNRVVNPSVCRSIREDYHCSRSSVIARAALSGDAVVDMVAL